MPGIRCLTGLTRILLTKKTPVPFVRPLKISRGDTMSKNKTALRHNKGKPPSSYILHYPKVTEVTARILEVGEVKYEKLNWKKGGNSDESYLDAAIRHMEKFVNGEPFDEELGTHHIGHAIWNLMTMFELNGHEIMDPVKFNKALKGHPGKHKEKKHDKKT